MKKKMRAMRPVHAVNGPERSSQRVRKTVYLTECNAYNLDALAAFEALRGSGRDRSAIVNAALSDWFTAHGYPSERFLKVSYE